MTRKMLNLFLKIVFITRAEGLILDTLKSYLPAADWLVNNGIEGYFGVRT